MAGKERRFVVRCDLDGQGRQGKASLSVVGLVEASQARNVLDCSGRARRGVAGKAGHGMARSGMAWQAWKDADRHGLAGKGRYGQEWPGVVWTGLAG